jgi:hypothetical protein
VNEIEIQIVEPEPAKTRLESRFDTLGPMIGVPQFCGHKDVFARDSSSSKPYPQGLAHLTLVPISLGAIEVSISGFQRVSGSTGSRSCIGNQRAKSERRHTAAFVIKHYPSAPKMERLNHDDISALSRAKRQRTDA